jgi:tRNA (guanine-N7-)-methyltransferase
MDGKTKERKRKVPSHFNKKSSKKKFKDDDAEMREDDNVDGEDEDDKETMVQPITTDGDRPQKRFYRQRAHCNPLAHNDSYEYPVRPEAMVWQTEALYPISTSTLQDSSSGPCSPRPPTVLDIGCGFGGLTLSLASLLPNEVILGMEIRAKVTEYVRLRIVAARKDGFDGKTTENPPKTRGKHAKSTSIQQHHDYNNCAVMRTNSMKFLPNFFGKGSIRKLFFCFPDPHFKRKNHPRRIISRRLLDEYAYVLTCSSSSNDNGSDGNANSDSNQGVQNGRLYCITDVKELHDWHVAACDAHPSFRRLLVSTANGTEATATTGAANEKGKDAPFEESSDPCIHAMRYTTEEGQKVDRNGGSKYYAVYERISHEQEKGQRALSSINASNFFA